MDLTTYSSHPLFELWFANNKKEIKNICWSNVLSKVYPADLVCCGGGGGLLGRQCCGAQLYKHRKKETSNLSFQVGTQRLKEIVKFFIHEKKENFYRFTRVNEAEQCLYFCRGDFQKAKHVLLLLHPIGKGSLMKTVPSRINIQLISCPTNLIEGEQQRETWLQ